MVKDFSLQAFIERYKIKIRAFPKTSRKRFWNGRAMYWRLRDVNVGLQGRKTFCASFCVSLIAVSRRAFLFVDWLLTAFVYVVLWEFWLRGNELHEVRTFASSLKPFLFVFTVVVVVAFSSLENYYGFRTTNFRVKTDHSVSLRWNKTFWTFPKRFVFFW